MSSDAAPSPECLEFQHRCSAAAMPPAAPHRDAAVHGPLSRLFGFFPHGPGSTVHGARNPCVGHCSASSAFARHRAQPLHAGHGGPAAYAQAFSSCDITNADIDGGGPVNFGDTNPFVLRLSGGQCGRLGAGLGRGYRFRLPAAGSYRTMRVRRRGPRDHPQPGRSPCTNIDYESRLASGIIKP
jgi:hypothetical protein